ncbi:MAG: GNAT family N-acetyltransferase [Aridibacter sp.]
MKSENASINKNDAAMIKILDFGAEYADEILAIQTECGLSVWSKNDYLSELERHDSIFKIAQSANQKIIGFALARLLINSNARNIESRNAAPIRFDSSEILNIAVRQSFQCKGIGQMIFDEVLRELERKNILEIWLEVRKSNTNAVNFYQKNNFKMQFERKNYYANPTENACVFQRLITTNKS